jgi:hypothetical protein
MTGRHPTQTSLPGEDLKPAWRVACVAYRSVRQAGHLDQPAWLAARAAIQSLRPDLDEDAAGQQASVGLNGRRVQAGAELRRGADAHRAVRLGPRGFVRAAEPTLAPR